MINARTGEGNIVRLRHLVINRSSQWVVARNVTNYCEILRINIHVLKLPPDLDGNCQGQFTLVDRDMYTFIPHAVFMYRTDSLSAESQNAVFSATACLALDLTGRSWKDLKRIADKVHKHVCGHSNYSDNRLLLERKEVWNTQVDNYLQRSLEQ